MVWLIRSVWKDSCMRPPSAVYLNALESRLKIILSNLSASTYPSSIQFPSIISNTMFFRFAKGLKYNVQILWMKVAKRSRPTRSAIC